MKSDLPPTSRTRDRSSSKADEEAYAPRPMGQAAPPTEGSGFLTRQSIIHRIEDLEPGSRLVERGAELEKRSPNLLEEVGSWNYDLHLGEEVFRSTEERLTRLGWGDDTTIRPGEFGLLTTEEAVNIPLDLAAFISLRFHIAVKGLVNVSGRHVDPGYSGKIVFSVFNASPNPVVVKRGDPIFMITFAKLEGVAPPRNRGEVGNLKGISSEMMERVMGQSVSLQRLSERLATIELSLRKSSPENLDARLNKIEALLRVVGTVGGIVLGAFLVWYFKLV